MPEKKEPDAITAISVKGFKSFADETRLEIRPLTLLAGANSSGKSSAMQPTLLLKQTLEVDYDPGPLLLHGSHAKFTSATQLLHKATRFVAREFRTGLKTQAGLGFADTFRRKSNEAFDLVQMDLLGVALPDSAKGNQILSLRPSMSSEELGRKLSMVPGLKLWRDRCFFQIGIRGAESQSFLARLRPVGILTEEFSRLIRKIIHVPGLRGNPTRTYPTTGAREQFSGTFENYVASVVSAWQETKDDRLERLGQAMESLGLSWRVRAKTIDATQVELLVGRLPTGKRGVARDIVNIADVGFGVSQVLPVLVALLIAEKGQLVYVEQPELHLHPRAQEALAEVLAEAANRGVQVVAETHSSILLLAVQALVAEGRLDPAKVKLHWFQRDSDGVTKVTSADLDPQGAYGDWPEDFGEVRAQAENRYLDAVEAKVFPPKKPKRNAKSR
jgi:hypothetical protein